MENPEQFVQAADLRVVSGQILATTLLTNGISHLIGIARKYVGFVVSTLIYLSLNYQMLKLGIPEAIAALCNIFVIYSGAVGISSIAATGSGKPSSTEEIERPKFFKRWW